MIECAPNPEAGRQAGLLWEGPAGPGQASWDGMAPQPLGRVPGPAGCSLLARGGGTLEGLALKRPRYGLPQAGANRPANGLDVQPKTKRHVLFPGVTLRPDVYGEKGLDISYNVSDNRTWTELTQALHHFLAGRV